MTIQLRPELEELIRQNVQRGPYASVDEFLESAVRLLHEQEAWLADHRPELADRIEAGWAAAERGELSEVEDVQARMRQRKESWLQRHDPA
jgi:putative addiction module CopG family antidote